MAHGQNTVSCDDTGKWNILIQPLCIYLEER
jgi:hypothetical protein